MRHFTSLLPLTPQDVAEIFSISATIKADLKQGKRPPLLQGRVLTQLFEKPSLRTRTSFEAAIVQLGGGCIFLSCKKAGLNGRESPADVARVLSSYSDAIVMRTFSQGLIEEFAQHAACPIINGLSDESHPCQAMTDLFTMKEVFGDLQGRRVVFVGDGNNVAASLAILTAMLGISLTLSSPDEYDLDDDFVASLRAKYPKADITIERDPHVAVSSADIVYTDVWASMGQEAEEAERKRVFSPYQVNAKLMGSAPATARFMHCLPAKRGKEVTDDVMEGPQNVAFLQAENRMHLAKGLLVWLLDALPAK